MKKIFAIFGIVLSLVFVCTNCSALEVDSTSDYIVCFDVMLVFARGSGGALGLTSEFFDVWNAAYKMKEEFGISARAVDLDYPAVEISTLQRIVRTYVSAGQAYSFGNSVKLGVSNLRLYYRAAHKKCPDMKFGFIGYSQGAMVIADAAKYFDADATLFLMMLGDPKTYLPEGEGLFPAACYGGKKSSWRTFAPTCRTSSGVFGQRKPYEEQKLAGKYSLWCNRNDYICGSSKNPFRNGGHTEYSGRGLINWGIPYLMKRAGYKKKPQLRKSSTDSVELSEEGISVIDEDVSTPRSVAPSEISVVRNDDKAYLKWDATVDAKYMLIRLNGVDLGYVETSRGELEIRDIDSEEEFRLELASMSEDGELSEVRELKVDPVDVSSLASQANQPKTIDKVPISNTAATSVTQETVAFETIADKTSVVEQPIEIKKKNGLSTMPGVDIIKIAITMACASSLLLLLFMKRRH